MALNDTRPFPLPPSDSSSITHISHEPLPALRRDTPAITPVEKKEVLENDDWEHDTINPRNWSFWRKWVAVGIVTLAPLHS
jgi:hypothetical protein